MFTKLSTRRSGAAAAMAVTGALVLGACAGGGGGANVEDGEPVTLNFAFWGNDIRAGLYEQAFDAFNEEYPNITIEPSFLPFPEFWERRQIEAAGGGLPDVMQFDYAYLRQYSENGLLLDLGPYLGNQISTDGLSEQILNIGVVNDTTYAIPTSTNAWGMFQNPGMLEEMGAEPYEGGTSWDDYLDWMAETSAAASDAGLTLWAGTDYTGRIQNFELQLRAEGEQLFTDDGEPNFDEARLAEFWEEGSSQRDGVITIPGQRLEEAYPLSAFDAAQTATELTWDNFGAGYLGNIGEQYPELLLTAPPTAVEGSQDLYLKPSMLHTISSTSENPEAAAILVDFLINSPEAAAAFGTNRGIPASESQLDSLSLEGFDAQIQDYEASIADRLGDAPPVPIVGYGEIEEQFRLTSLDLGLGVITVDQAVDRFFTEMNVIIDNN